MNPNLHFLIAAFLLTTLACRPEPRQTTGAEEDKTASMAMSSRPLSITTEEKILRAAPTDKNINPVRVSVQPEVISFKDDTEVVPADPNVEPAIVDKVIPIPKDLPVFIPGRDGIRLPDTVVVRPEVVPIPALPPIPASMPSFKDWATSSIQYLGRQHGFEIESVTTMLKDSRGHIWFGSAWQSAIQGVSRYDGVSFTNFPIGQVGSMLEDTLGRLWFGTTNGPMVYDGHSFTVFKGEPGLAGARAMLKDRQGNLWFGTPKGLYRYIPGTSTRTADDPADLSGGKAVFTRYTTEKGLSANFVSAILQDKTGSLWLGTGKGLDRYDPKDYGGLGSFTHYPTEKGLGGSGVSSILEDKRGNLWFGSRKGLYRYAPPDSHRDNEGQGSFHHYTGKTGPGEYMVFDILEDSRENLWIGVSSGLIRLELDAAGTGGTFTTFMAREGLSGENAWSLLLNDHDNVWTGLLGGGVSRHIDADFHFYTDKEGLPANTVRSYLEDSRGNIWWGAMGGITRYEPGGDAPGHARFVKYLKVGADVPLFAVRSIREDSRGDVWFECDHALFHFDPADEWTLTTYPGLGNGRFNPKLEDSRKNLWFGTRNGLGRYDPDGAGSAGTFTRFGLQGVNARHADMVEDRWGKVWLGIDNDLIRYDPEGDQGEGAFTRYAAEEILNGDHILSMKKDKQGNIWMVTNQGLSQFKPDAVGGRADLIHFTAWEGLERTTREVLWEDSRGNFWIRSDQGLSRFSPEAGEGEAGLSAKGAAFMHYPAEEGFANIRLEGSLEDSRGNLWFRSLTNGVWRYDRVGERFTNYTTENGLKGAMASAVVEDRNQHIWIVTTDGINLLVPQPGEPGAPKADPYQIFAFDKSNGIKPDLSQQTRTFIDRSDQLWWTTHQGLGKLDLKRFQLPEVTVPQISMKTVEIAQTFVDYRSLSDTAYRRTLAFGEDLSGAFDSVAAFYNYPLGLSLPHHLNHLTFQFSAIDWASPQMLKYRYFLEGEDDGWSQVGAENWAEYRNLRPGNYTFRVKAIGMAQTWSQEFEYPFRILPPWWLIWQAYLLYGLLAAFVLFLVYRFLLARRLARAETERRMELDAFKVRLYTNITHEFRTPLTIILGMARQIKDDPKKWYGEGLEMIARNGRQLLGLVNQMLDLSKLDRGKLTLKMQRAEIITFIRYLVQSFESYAGGKDIQLHFLKETNQLEMDFDPNQLTKVVGNLLSNAVKYTPPGGQVYVLVRKQPEGRAEASEVLELKVKDTGRGIPPEELPHIFDRFYQADSSDTRKADGTGIGLALTKELIQLMGGSIEVQSKLGEGSDFTVMLPVSRSAPRGEPVPMYIDPPYLETIVPTGLMNANAAENGWKNNPVKASDDTERELPVALLIEDNPDVLTYLASCLEGDYQLEFAANGQEGIDQAMEIVPDIIISDVMMPEKDGYEVCEILKEDIRTSHIPIILLTAKADQDSRIAGLKSGADAYLAKPFDKEELNVRLEKLLELRRQLQARYGDPDAIAQREEAAMSREDLFLRNLRKTIEENLSDESFGIARLCRKIGLSRSQLHNKLKALTGQSTSLYIRAIRLEKAKELLRNTDLNISEVAYEVGFRTPLYFTQVFTEEVGAPPSGYRNR